MRAFARVLLFAGTGVDVEELQTICIFSGLGLLLSLVAVMTCGTDWWSALAACP